MSRELAELIAEQTDRELGASEETKQRAREARRSLAETAPNNIEERVRAARTDGFAPAEVDSWDALWKHWQGE